MAIIYGVKAAAEFMKKIGLFVDVQGLKLLIIINN